MKKRRVAKAAAEWAVSRDLLLNRILPLYLHDLAIARPDRKEFIHALGAVRLTCRAFRDCPGVEEEWQDVYAHSIIWYMCTSGPNVYWHLTRGGLDAGLVVQFKPATFNCCTLKSLDGKVARINAHEEVSIIPRLAPAADPQKWTLMGWMKPYLMGQCTGPPAFTFDLHREHPGDPMAQLMLSNMHHAVFHRKALCGSFPLRALTELESSRATVVVSLATNNLASDGRCRQPITIWRDIAEFRGERRENDVTWLTRCPYDGREKVKHMLA